MWPHPTALLGSREAMNTTNTTSKEYTDGSEQWDNDWCDGLTSETLPCFACYDRTRDYVIAPTARSDAEDRR